MQHGYYKLQKTRLRCSSSELGNVSECSKGSHSKTRAIQIYFLPLGSSHRSVSALSPGRGRILSNLSCLMKNSASWPPISAVSGCYVRYRGGGAGKRGGNCSGLQHCMIRIIAAMELIHAHFPRRPLLLCVRNNQMCVQCVHGPWVGDGTLW